MQIFVVQNYIHEACLRCLYLQFFFLFFFAYLRLSARVLAGTIFSCAGFITALSIA